MFKEFKEFAIKGNMMEMAVGIMLGAAFKSFIDSLVNDILMPPIGLLLGNADFSELYIMLKEGATPGPYASLTAAHEAGAVLLKYGLFINQFINFAIIAFVLFMIVRTMNRLRREEESIEA